MVQLNKKTIMILTCLCLMFSIFVQTSSASSTTNGFFDCDNHWAKKEIDVLSRYGIISSRGDNKFAPDESITRGEYIDIISKIAGISEAAYTNSYSDVYGSEWYAGALQGVHNAGFINSAMIENGKFEGDKPAKRQEIAYLAKYDKQIALSLDPEQSNEELKMIIAQYDGARLENVITENYTLTGAGTTIPYTFYSIDDLNASIIYLWDGNSLIPKSKEIELGANQ